MTAGNVATGGAEFVVTLPRSAEAPTTDKADARPRTKHSTHFDVTADERPLPAAPSESDQGDLPSVLVIEDHDDLRHYIGDCLAEDFHCTLVADGEQGVAHAMSEMPDLVLSDVMLPGIDGFEVTHQLRNDVRSSHIPIVLLTAREDRESLMRGLTEKADEYLTKPFDAEELRLRLHNLIELRSVMQQRALQAWEEQQDSPASDVATETIYGPRDTQFLEKLHATLTSHFADNDFGVSDLAEALAMSNRQLRRKLGALLGERPADYLRDFRLRQARQLLRAGSPVGVVAQDCGFSTQAHFGQCFKALYGVTPGEFAADPSAARQRPSETR